MKTCVIYANCQGLAVGSFLRGTKFAEEYEIINIINHRFIGEKTDLPVELFQKTDLFIYQPIDKKREIYCTLPEYPNGIANVLPSRCKRIAFPYIYNDGINIMYDKGLDIVHKEKILFYKQMGNSIDVVLKDFKDGGVFFNLVNRFNTSMDILEEKEKDCDIIVSDVIKTHFRDQKIFYTQNHVTNIVLFKVVNEILRMTRFEQASFEREEFFLKNCVRPITPYEIQAFRFTYQTKPDEGWYEFYKALIERIYAGDYRECNEIYSANLLQV